MWRAIFVTCLISPAAPLSHFLIVVYALLRSRMRAPVPVGERDSYQSVSSGTTVTPESLSLSPRAQRLPESEDAANLTPKETGAEPA